MKNNAYKIICLLLAVSLAFSLCGCITKKNPDNTSSSGVSSEETADTNQTEEYEDEPLEDTDDYISDDFDDDYDSFGDDYLDDSYSENSDWDYEDDYAYDDDYEDDYSYSIYPKAELTIKNGSAPVQDNFLGFGAVYHGFGLMKNSLGYDHTERSLNAELDVAEKSGITIARTSFFWNWCWQGSGNNMTYDLSDDKENNYSMWAFYSWCREMQDRGIELQLNGTGTHRKLYETYWHNGKYETNNITEGPFFCLTSTGEYDRQATFNKYTDFIVALYKQLNALGIKNAKYFATETEPGFYYWADGTEEEYHAKAKEVALELLEVNNMLSQKFKDADMRQNIKLVGPNEANNTGNNDESLLIKYVYELDTEKSYDYYSSHTYITSKSDPFYSSYDGFTTAFTHKLNAVNGDKDKFIIDEFNFKVGSTVAEINDFYDNNEYAGSHIGQMSVALLNMGIKASYIWALFDQQYPEQVGTGGEFVDGVQICGILPNFQKTTTPSKGYYAFSLINKYMGVSGSKIYGCDYGDYGPMDSVYTAMVEMPDGNISILVVNGNVMAANVTVNLEKALGKTLYKHEYNPIKITPSEEASVIPASAKITNVESTFKDVIPAMGVTVYTTAKY